MNLGHPLSSSAQFPTNDQPRKMTHPNPTSLLVPGGVINLYKQPSSSFVAGEDKNGAPYVQILTLKKVPVPNEAGPSDRYRYVIHR